MHKPRSASLNRPKEREKARHRVKKRQITKKRKIAREKKRRYFIMRNEYITYTQLCGIRFPLFLAFFHLTPFCLGTILAGEKERNAKQMCIVILFLL